MPSISAATGTSRHVPPAALDRGPHDRRRCSTLSASRADLVLAVGDALGERLGPRRRLRIPSPGREVDGLEHGVHRATDRGPARPRRHGRPLGLGLVLGAGRLDGLDPRLVGRAGPGERGRRDRRRPAPRRRAAPSARARRSRATRVGIVGVGRGLGPQPARRRLGPARPGGERIESTSAHRRGARRSPRRGTSPFSLWCRLTTRWSRARVIAT